jgi:uncharacterized protein (DUF433 family)
MPQAETSYLNTGIYSVAEAARLTGVSSGRIRRWLRGYRLKSKTKSYSLPPLWNGQLEAIDHKLALGFLDLIEVRFVEAFLKMGVTWSMIHKARERATARFPYTSHPFCSNRFVTDGREIFVQLHKETGESSLIEIVQSQQVFAEIVRPFMMELEFGEGNVLERWWPMGKNKRVALDPKRNFGQPTIFQDGIPTKILAKSVKANGSVAEVARWYEVSPESVADAVEYEQKLAA